MVAAVAETVAAVVEMVAATVETITAVSPPMSVSTGISPIRT